MDKHRYLIPALALLTVWRIALLPTLELSPVEALGWWYGEHPQLWHVEMGPLVPWLVKLSTALVGHSELGVRLLAPLLVFAASVSMWRLARGAFDPTVAAWALVFLQVMPGFNVAATTMTASSVGSAALCGYLLALRIGLHRVPQWHGSWWAAAVCMSAALLCDWRNVLAWGCTLAYFTTQRRLRHHLRKPGFWMITLGMALPLVGCFSWNVQMGWPCYYAGEAEPMWNGVINGLRWTLLVSPALLALTVWSWSQRQERSTPDQRLLFFFALPFLLLDAGWGPREVWPSMGWPFGWAVAFTWLAQRSIEHAGVTTQRKILLRTMTVILAAAVSMCLLRTDVLRRFGVPWGLAELRPAGGAYRHFFKADPSACMMGWKQGAELLAVALRGAEEPPWVLAENWELAGTLDFYLEKDAALFRPSPDYPRVQVLQSIAPDTPWSSYPRYDERARGVAPFAGKSAIFVSAEARRQRVPAAVARAFHSTELLSVVHVMHGGQVLRELKFFACHGYRPPEL